MARYLFRRPWPADAKNLAANMRQADRDEIAAASGRPDIEAVVSESIAMSPVVVAVERDGKLLCIGGAARRSLLSDTGTPWMLGTEALEREGRLFMAHGKQCVDALLQYFTTLENYVDARNVKSIRWLRRMGFTVHDPEPYGHAGLPFHKFTARR